MRDDVTVVLCTHAARPRPYFDRAYASAKDQAPIVVADNGDNPQPRCHIAWWDGIYRATTPYVALLYDDDWYEPGFIDTLTPELQDDRVAYAWSNATLRFPDGTSGPNLQLPLGRHVVDSRSHGERLTSMRYTISPGCAVFRRAEALTCLLPGGTPLGTFRSPLSGPDALLMLLPLFTHPVAVGFGECLVNFDAGPQSTTIDAISDPEKQAALDAGYAEARAFYLRLGGACGG